MTFLDYQVDDVAAYILVLGPSCLLLKQDLKLAYRQFPVDLGDYHLVYSWQDQLYFDTVLPMGLSAMACQLVTNAVCYMFPL